MEPFDFSSSDNTFKDSFNFMTEERWGTASQLWRRDPFIDDSDELTASYGPDFFETHDQASPHKLCQQCASVFAYSAILSGPNAITGPWKNLIQELKEGLAASKALEESGKGGSSSQAAVAVEGETTPLEDWLYHPSLESLAQSAEARCHFCCLVWAHHQRGDVRHWKDDDSCMEVRLRIYKIPNGNLHMQIYLGSLFDQGLRVLRSKFIRCRSAIGRFDQLRDQEPHPAYQYFKTSSAAHVDLARGWLNECHEKHLACRPEGTFLPTRLVHISEDAEFASLHTTKQGEKDIVYCTLSHCWGDATDIIKLTSESARHLHEGIPLSEFPRTFREAMTIARSLDISYIWIDSLCIFQDSSEDWAKESSSMGSIYECSYVTIAAALAENAHRGCFVNRDPLRYLPCRIVSNEHGNIYADFEEGEVSFASEIENTSRWITRGWVFQERALSSRIVFFGKRSLYWSCAQGQATELDPVGWGHMGRGQGIIQPFEPGGPISKIICLTSEAGHQSFLDLRFLLQIHDRVPPDKFNMFLHKLWYNLVHDYSQLKLTKSHDKLIAISGIAQRIHERTGSRYCAGLWYRCFPFALLWYVAERPYPKPDKYRAPSWSWAAVDGSITEVLNSVYEIAPIDVIEVSMDVGEVQLDHQPFDLSSTGQTFGGRLEARGPLRRVEHLTELEVHGKSRYDITDAEGVVLGKFTPDTESSDFDVSLNTTHEIYALLVLSVSARDEGGNPKFLGNSGYQKVVAGLVLQKRDEYYERIGIMIEASKEQNPAILNWFFSVEDSVITIR